MRRHTLAVCTPSFPRPSPSLAPVAAPWSRRLPLLRKQLHATRSKGMSTNHSPRRPSASPQVSSALRLGPLGCLILRPPPRSPQARLLALPLSRRARRRRPSPSQTSARSSLEAEALRTSSSSTAQPSEPASRATGSDRVAATLAQTAGPSEVRLPADRVGPARSRDLFPRLPPLCVSLSTKCAKTTRPAGPPWVATPHSTSMP